MNGTSIRGISGKQVQLNGTPGGPIIKTSNKPTAAAFGAPPQAWFSTAATHTAVIFHLHVLGFICVSVCASENVCVFECESVCVCQSKRGRKRERERVKL